MQSCNKDGALHNIVRLDNGSMEAAARSTSPVASTHILASFMDLLLLISAWLRLTTDT
jgi:hypothetical protein